MSDEVRKECAKMLTRLRFKEGRTRQWLAKETGVNKLYISYAASETRRSKNGKKKEEHLCPIAAIHKIMKWGLKHGHC